MLPEKNAVSATPNDVFISRRVIITQFSLGEGPHNHILILEAPDTSEQVIAVFRTMLMFRLRSCYCLWRSWQVKLAALLVSPAPL